MDCRDYITAAFSSICDDELIRGLSLAFCREGQPPLLFSDGIRGHRSEFSCVDPVNGQTAFQLASISKFVTSCLVVELAKQKRLDLDQSITSELCRVWPTFSVQSLFDARLTWSHLLSHRAGFLDEGGLHGQALDGCCLPEVALWSAQPDLIYKNRGVGRFHYSACGYWLIQQLLEQCIGSQFSDLLLDVLFRPLQMTNSFVGSPDSTLQNYACGHNSKGPLSSCFMRYPGCEAVAGIWSSASDLLVLMQHLLRRSTCAGTTGSQRPNVMLADLLQCPFPGAYRFGLRRMKRYEEEFWFHTGLNPGFSSFIIFSQRRSAGVAFLINSEVWRPTPDAFLDVGCLLIRRYGQEDSG